MRNAQVGDLAKQIRGVSYNKNDVTSEAANGSLPVLRANNISNSLVLEKDFVFVPRKYIKEEQLLKYGDILIAASSGSISIVGKAAMIERDMNASFGAFCKVMRPDFKKVCPRYFKFFFETSYYRTTISHLAEGININNLKTEHFNNLQIPLPPLPVQQKIAAILDAADLHRQKTKALIEKYDQLTQSLFLEMFGDPVRNEKGWEKVEMRRLCSFTRENITADNIPDDTNYIGLECIEKETGNIIHVFKVKAAELKSNKFGFSSDHILYGKLRPYLNKVALPDFDGVCSTDIIPILPKPSMTNKMFICSIMKAKGFVSFATEKSSGANLPRISPREIERYLIINPPVTLQAQFAERVKTINSQKQFAIEALTKSEQLFNSLLQRAFKGELAN